MTVVVERQSRIDVYRIVRFEVFRFELVSSIQGVDQVEGRFVGVGFKSREAFLRTEPYIFLRILLDFSYDIVRKASSTVE